MLVLNMLKFCSNYDLNNASKDNADDRSNSQSKAYSEQIKLQIAEDAESGSDSEVEISQQICDNDRQGYSNYLINPTWVQDKRLKSGKVDFLPITEEKFWKQLIEKYLHPIENDMEKQVWLLYEKKIYTNFETTECL